MSLRVLQNRYEIPNRVTLSLDVEKMATAKNELLLLRTFRLALPAALLATLLWTLEFGDSTRQWIYNGLGANANNIVFIIGLVLVVGLYWFMGVYERKILYENRHTRPAF
jgi:hypothetical protein